jgi:hypothetical protein
MEHLEPRAARCDAIPTPSGANTPLTHHVDHLPFSAARFAVPDMDDTLGHRRGEDARDGTTENFSTSRRMDSGPSAALAAASGLVGLAIGLVVGGARGGGGGVARGSGKGKGGGKARCAALPSGNRGNPRLLLKVPPARPPGFSFASGAVYVLPRDVLPLILVVLPPRPPRQAEPDHPPPQRDRDRDRPPPRHWRPPCGAPSLNAVSRVASVSRDVVVSHAGNCTGARRVTHHSVYRCSPRHPPRSVPSTT